MYEFWPGGKVQMRWLPFRPPETKRPEHRLWLHSNLLSTVMMSSSWPEFLDSNNDIQFRGYPQRDIHHVNGCLQNTYHCFSSLCPPAARTQLVTWLLPHQQRHEHTWVLRTRSSSPNRGICLKCTHSLLNKYINKWKDGIIFAHCDSTIQHLLIM